MMGWQAVVTNIIILDEICQCTATDILDKLEKLDALMAPPRAPGRLCLRTFQMSDDETLQSFVF